MGGLMTERSARALLSRVAEPGDTRVSRLVAVEGGLGAVEAIRSALADGATWAQRYSARLTDADPESDLAAAARLGGRLLVPGDLEWPAQLADLGESTPWALWVRGTVDLRLSALRSVAVVGARAATPYGTHVASLLGSDLAAAGWTVVSGGAFGIDAAAHAGALAARGVTVGVLACGVDVAYPPRHEALFARIAADGALVSEVAPGAAPHRTRFLVRNRVIAALTRGTVVVEAALRSGALATARDAERLGRPLLVVPGPITSELSAGVHRELRAGATAVTCAAEVIEAVGELGADLAPRADGPMQARDGLDPMTRRVLDGVPARRAATLDSVARTAGVAPAEAAAALGLLELAGFVRSGLDGWRLARPSGAPG